MYKFSSSAVVTSGGVDNPPTNDLGTSGGCSDWLGTWGGTSSSYPDWNFLIKNTPVAIVV